MIKGQVTADREAVIPLAVQGVGGDEVDIEAVLDTGFTDFLTLSPTSIAQLGLLLRERAEYTLADGSKVWFNVYRAVAVWDGHDRDVLILEADGGPLVGMSLLYGHEVHLQVVDGGDVTIQALP